jgi:sterol desaturase/sphingolipid hydroxylase (fatty acid hydroxylase superfamily)
MRDLSITHLIDLVVAEVPDAEERIQKMFEWHFERVMTLSRWILGAAASLVIAVLAAFFKAELQLACWQTGLIVLAALATGTYGVYRLWELRSVHRQFIAALKLFCELKEIRPFLIRYREEIR